MSVTFSEYVKLMETIQAAEQLDEGAPEYLNKMVDAFKAAVRARSEKKAAELRAKINAEFEKRKALRTQKAELQFGKKPGELSMSDLEDALPPEDKKFLAKMDKRISQSTRGTQGTQGPKPAV